MIYERGFEPTGELCGFWRAGENMKSKDRLTAAVIHEHADTQPSLRQKCLWIYCVVDFWKFDFKVRVLLCI